MWTLGMTNQRLPAREHLLGALRAWQAYGAFPQGVTAVGLVDVVKKRRVILIDDRLVTSAAGTWFGREVVV